MELITKLGINWQQLVAQAVNFAIIMGVLAYFVYKPALRTIDARTERIRKAMAEADEVEKQKKDLETFRQEQLSKIDAEAGVILEKAKQDAERMRHEILENAKKEADAVLQKGEKQLAEERSRVFTDVQDTLNAAIIGMTQKILQREFTDKDQARVLQEIEKDLPALLAK